MKSCYRLKKNHQYNYVYKHSQSVADKTLVLLFCKSNHPQTRVGFSVSKKYGKAVRRNRLRRQLKAAASQFVPNVKDGYSLVFVPRSNVDFVFADILQSMQYLFEKAGLLK